MADYDREIDALGRWLVAAAGLKSMRLMQSPPKVARPVILWQAPHRQRDRNISRYQYVNAVTQYGKLYATSLDQLNDLQEKLLKYLEDRDGILDVFDTNGVKIAILKEVEVEFMNAENLDVPIRVRYEATYGRPRPDLPPPAKTVYTKLEAKGGQENITS